MSKPSRLALQESMLFNYETVARTDYREGQILPVIPTVYKEKPEPKRQTFEPLKFVGTMSGWRNYVPFTAHYKPKDILQTNPCTPQRAFEKVVDDQREEVQRTRPRLIMTPAVGIDDMTNQETRDILIKSMYTTEMEEKMQRAATRCDSLKAPLPDLPAPANPVYLPKLRPPKVPDEWRMDSVHWDRRQLRSSVDATKYYWMRPEHEPTSCNICEESKIVSAHRKRLARHQNMTY